MRRIVLAAVLLLAHVAPAAQVSAPAAPDGIGRLLQDIERAIGSGRILDFRALAIDDVPEPAVSRVAAAMGEGAGASAVVRERMRRPVGPGFDVVADVLVSRENRGRLATWLVIMVPEPLLAGRFKVADVRELAAFDGLLRLRLDTSRQFTVKGLTITAPDLRISMPAGTAFVAESPNGVTGIVLRGRGELLFTPPDPAEQLQLRIFSFRSTFRTDVDSIFIRLSPHEFREKIAEQSLVPAPVNAGELARAQLVFDEFWPQTFNLDLRALTSDRWSLEPAVGNLVVEFHTSRHGWLTYTRSSNEVEDITLFDRDDNRNICQYSSVGRGVVRGLGYSEDEGTAYDVEHYALDVAFDPARSLVSGRGRLRIRMNANDSTSLTIRLAPSLAVTAVSSPELGELLAVRIIGQTSLLVGLPRPIERGAQLTFDVAYSGRLPPQAIEREGIAVDPSPGPEQAGQSQSLSSQDEPRLIVVPEPRFMYSNRVLWYPQGPASDYATAELRITAPAEFHIAAVGRLIGSSGPPVAIGQAPKPGATRSVEYVADRPVRYLATLMSRLQTVGRGVVDVPSVAPGGVDSLIAPATSVGLEVLATPRVVNRNRQTLERAAAMVRYFSQTIGEAPYPSLTIAALDDNLPGGHSPAGLVSLHQALPSTPYSWAEDPVAFENVYPQFFLAHEIAHQWWGQAVGWRNYHEQWLSEGLAQYFAALYAAEERGPELLTTLIETMRETSKSVLGQGPISLGYRVGHIRNDGRAFRSIVYNKAAVVLHMLRRFVGDEAFFAGLRKYYTDWRFRKAGTDHFQAAIEAVSQVKLDRFFDQWIRGFTIPKIRVSSRMEADGRSAVIRVEQPENYFDFPLTVAIQYADGKTEERTLRVVGPEFEERFTPTSPVRRVTVKDQLSYFDQIR